MTASYRSVSYWTREILETYKAYPPIGHLVKVFKQRTQRAVGTLTAKSHRSRLVASRLVTLIARFMKVRNSVIYYLYLEWPC